MAERKGDAYQIEIGHWAGGHMVVSAHDDGGVTVQKFNHRGDEMGRVTFMREAWDIAVQHVEDSRKVAR